MIAGLIDKHVIYLFATEDCLLIGWQADYLMFAFIFVILKFLECSRSLREDPKLI